MVALGTNRFGIQQFHVMPTESISVFCMDLIASIFLTSTTLAGFYNRDGVCLLRGKGLMFNSSLG